MTGVTCRAWMSMLLRLTNPKWPIIQVPPCDICGSIDYVRPYYPHLLWPSILSNSDFSLRAPEGLYAIKCAVCGKGWSVYQMIPVRTINRRLAYNLYRW